jgi:hypothetical protein
MLLRDWLPYEKDLSRQDELKQIVSEALSQKAIDSRPELFLRTELYGVVEELNAAKER